MRRRRCPARNGPAKAPGCRRRPRSSERLRAGMRGGEGEMAARMPILCQHHMRELPPSRLITGTTSSPRGTARPPPGQKSFWISTISRTSRSPIVNLSVIGPDFRAPPSVCPLRRRAAPGHPRLQPGSCSRFEVAQRLRQAFEIVRGPRPDFGQSRRWHTRRPSFMTSSISGSPAWGSRFERQDIAGHTAVRSIATPDLLAARPSRLAGRTFAARQSGIFLQLVGAIERRHIG